MNAVVQQNTEQEQSNLPQTSSETAAIMSVIERVAMSPDADIDKLERMLDMQERVLDRNAKEAYTAALAAMQIELPRVIEHGTGHNRAKYAKLEDINDTIRPALQKHGFAITFRIKSENSLIWVTTVLSHKNGHSEETSIPLSLDDSGNKNAVQAVGSSISYGKRYGLCAMLNISTGDDDDGQSASNPSDSVDRINKQQLDQIMALLSKANKSTAAFCKLASIDRVHDLEASRFSAAVARLKKEINKGGNSQ